MSLLFPELPPVILTSKLNLHTLWTGHRHHFWLRLNFLQCLTCGHWSGIWYKWKKYIFWKMYPFKMPLCPSSPATYNGWDTAMLVACPAPAPVSVISIIQSRLRLTQDTITCDHIILVFSLWIVKWCSCWAILRWESDNSMRSHPGCIREQFFKSKPCAIDWMLMWMDYKKKIHKEEEKIQ